jgi:uncharacterized repeat protein (TIGR01451 family)
LALVQGAAVTWTYEVTNTGNVPLTNVLVTDTPEGAICTIATLAVGATDTCTKTSTAVAGAYTNTGCVVGTSPLNASVNGGCDPEHYFGQTPSISIVKKTNGSDNNSAPGVYVAVGSTVSFSYDVTNTGNVTLTNVTVTDDKLPGSICVIASLAAGATQQCTASTVAVAGQYVNMGTVVGTPPIGPPVTDEDPDHHYGQTPSISLVKKTNGTDNNSAPGVQVTAGSTVTWTYLITNSGNVALTNVALVDDKVGAITCPATTLAVGASMTCTKTGVAIAGQYTNMGTVTGKPPVGPNVTANDPDNYFGNAPAITLVKKTNGTDNNSAPGLAVTAGSTVTWTYLITNSGNVALTNVALVDDKVGTITCPATTLAVGASMTCTKTGVAISGQYTNIGTVTGKPPVGPNVTASDPDNYFGTVPPPPGVCYVGSAAPQIGANQQWVVNANGTITLRTTLSRNFVDNTYGTGQVGWPGNNHTFNHLVGSDKVQLALYDTAGVKKLEFKLDYITASSGAPGGYASLGVTGGDGGMLVGSAASIVSADSSLAANFRNGYVLTTNSPATNASYAVNASYPNWIYDVWYEVTFRADAFGSAGFGYPRITDMHASPSKTGNNTEPVILCDEVPTPPCTVTTFDLGSSTSSATSGTAGNIRTFTAGAVSVKASAFSRAKSNGAWATAFLGQFGTYGLGVTDGSEGTGANDTHKVDNGGDRLNYILFEFSQPVVITKAYLDSIGADSDATVWVGTQSSPFTNHLTLSDALLTSLGTAETSDGGTTARWATFNGTAVSGNVLVIAAKVNDSAANDAFKVSKLEVACQTSSPSIRLVKKTNGTDNNSAPGLMVVAGSTVTWTYEVTNTGNVTLTNLSLVDDKAGTVSCPVTSLAAGATTTCTKTGIAVAGQYTNIGTVTGKPPAGANVTDTDPDNYFGSAPAVTLLKKTNGTNNNSAPGVQVATGSTVTWTYLITNTGNVPLTAVTLTDDKIGAITCPATTLAVGADMTCTKTGVAITGQYTNIGTVTGKPPVGSNVSAADPDNYFGSVPPPPCSVTTFSFAGSTSSTSGTAGNVRTFSAGGVSVKASAFSRTKSGGAWATAFLGQYGTYGLGVTDGSEGTGANDTHKVDNGGDRNNYILLAFSAPTTITRAYLDSIGADSDAQIWVGTVANAYTTTISLNDAVLAGLGAAQTSTGGASARWASFNGGNVSGNVVVIAALTTESNDAFKLTKVESTCAPPTTPVCQAPVAGADSRTVIGTAPLAISVLTNDTDPQGRALSVVPTAFTQPANGTVTLSGNTFTFTARDGFVGVTTFTYTVTNGACTSTATVTVVVAPSNEVCYVGTARPQIGASQTWWSNPDGSLTIRTTLSRNFNDNTYGTGQVGWPGNNHTFNHLVGSDAIQVALYDATGVRKMEVKLDYISASSAAPSGYKSLGVSGGDGAMVFGSSSYVLGADSSLAKNFNQFGYVLTANSPATTSTYTTNASYPNWIWDAYYEVTVNPAAFGSAGFGYPRLTSMHASPSKTGSNTEPTAVTECGDDGTPPVVDEHDEGDNCDHEKGAKGHKKGDDCDHERKSRDRDRGHHDGDDCDHEKGKRGHKPGDNCDHDRDARDHDEDHEDGDRCDHDLRKDGHKPGDKCAHERENDRHKKENDNHDRGKNGHREGDNCDRDKANRASSSGRRD